MKILIVLLFITMLAFSGCEKDEEPCCPDKDVVVMVLTPMGYLNVDVKKGFFNKDKEGENYVNLETYNEMKEETEEEEIKEELKKQSEDAVKETDKALGI